jgi:Protein of unknown function (DUF998)
MKNYQEKIQRVTSYLSFGLVILSLIILALLHLLEPEFNTLGHLISEYEIGNYRWLMSLVFFCLGDGSLFLVLAIKHDLHIKNGYIGEWWLMLIGIAFIGAGIFAPDITSGLDQSTFTTISISGSLHTVFGLFVIFAAPIAFTLLYRSLTHNQQWFSMVYQLRWITFLPWIGLASFFVSLVAYGAIQQPMVAWLDLRTLVSITNRFMVLTYCIWLLFVTWFKLQEGKTILQS